MKHKTFIKIFLTIFTLLGLLSIYPSLSFAQDCPDWAVCGEVVGDGGSLVVEEYGITATTEETDKTTAIGVYGVGTINELDNSGGYTISAEAMIEGNDNPSAFGVYANNKINKLTNSGTISASASSSSEGASPYVAGVEAYAIDELINNGNISATAFAEGIDAEADATGVEAYVYELEGGDYIGILNNSGKISADATAIADEYAYAYACGVYASNNIENLTNSGTISATATSTAEGDYSRAYAYGIDAETIEELDNKGTISATATSNAEEGDAYAEAYGVYAYSDINKLINSGTISATAISNGYNATSLAMGVSDWTWDSINELNNSGKISAEAMATADNEAYAEAYGVSAWSGDGYIGSLTNSGTISATATAKGYYSTAYAYGVDAYDIDTLTNSGTISATATAEGNYSTAYAYGVDAYEINTLNNSGTISAEARATANDNAHTEGYGVYADTIDKLTNSGTISAKATSISDNSVSSNTHGIYAASQINSLTNYGTIEAVSHSIGTAEYSNYSEAYGVYAGHIEELKNYGTIRSKAIAEFSNENENVEIYSSAVYTGGPLTLVNLVNYGTIEAIAEAKGTVANYVDIYASAIDTGSGYAQNIYNEGIIRTTVTTEYKDSEIEAYGVSTNGNSDENNPSTITNKGTISVIVNAPSDSDPTKISIAGIKIGGGNVTLSNYGSINIESSVKGVKAHSLWIHGSGNVTLQDKFAITFGTPGIDPSVDSSTNSNQRPIYLASGTLNLNDTVLIARADSRNLKLGEKYYLIYNDGGTVNGQWGGLEKGYSNPNFNVSWAGEDLGENSAVVFTYEPKTSAITPAVGGMAGAPIMINAVVGLIIFSDHLHPFLIGESKFNPTMFASSAVSDVPVRTDTKYSKGLWFMPVYTKTKAKDLGFDADSYGFSFGLGGDLASNLYGGIFAGYLRNNLDFKVREAVDEDQDLFFGGLGFLYSPKPWYGRFLTYAYTAEHDYTGRTGLNYDLSEKANYRSKGFYTELTAGYIFGDKIKFAPEVGLSYGYYKTKSFKTTVSLNPSLERYYEPDSLDVFKAIAGFNVKADWNNTHLFGGFRLEQALGDNDISVINYLPGQPKYKLEKSVADTTAVIHVGLSHNLSKQISFELGARADINGDYKAYTGRGVLKIAF